VAGNKKDELQPIIIKKIKKGGGGHHGGAWKVAYADFVTAMMAFFLMLWLLNMSTKEQLTAIGNYFDPSHPSISDTESGAGGLMGGLSVSTEGAMATEVQTLTEEQPTGVAGDQEETTDTTQENIKKQLEEQLRAEENERFEKAKEELEKKIAENPELAALAENLMIDITPEGLRIQIIDQDGKPMFASGSPTMYGYTKSLIKAVADVINIMPNNVSVRGHTDAHPYGAGAKYTNWELSADRANSCRRTLLHNGVPVERLSDVMGKADRELLIADDPFDARNRRITIILLRESIEKALQRGAFGKGEQTQEEDGTPKHRPLPIPEEPKKPVHKFERTPGEVYFP